MFVGEYLLRYRLHPEFERATLTRRRCTPTPTAARRHDVRARLIAARRPRRAVRRRRAGDGAISRRQYLADAVALAERLPGAGAMLNLSSDRYRFAVGLGAALLRGHTSLLPPNHDARHGRAPARALRRHLRAGRRHAPTATACRP